MDIDDTDLFRLSHRPSTCSALIVDGPHMMHTEDDGERIFQRKPSGLLEGQILKLNNSGKLFGDVLFPDMKKRLEHIAAVVGIIYAGYKTDGNDELEYWSGSGFRVSEDVIITAEHVVKPIHQDGAKTYKLEKIYVFFGADATEDKEISSNQLSANDDAFELKPLSREVDSHFKDLMKFQAEGKEDFEWKTLNDFSFLKFADRKPTTSSFALPVSPKTFEKLTETTNCFVIGYPGHVSLVKFKEDYGSDAGQVETLYEAVRQQMQNFEHKIISVGVCTHGTPGGLLAHRCPTLRGTSGGLFGILDDDEIKFAGVHIGGSKRMDNNFAVPANMPAFVYSYMRNVVTKDFLEKNKGALQPLLEYYEQLKKTFPFM